MKITLLKESPLPSIIGNDERPDSVVLFVHGLGGNYWTWNVFANRLKTEWIEADTFGLEYDEYYQTQGFLNKIPILRNFIMMRQIIRGPGIEILSVHLKTIIEEVCDEYKNVVIVAHSMGGLVARKYILNLLKETKKVGKIKGLITYATPHKGSKWANWYLVFC